MSPDLFNQKDKLKSSLIFDEFPTVYLKGMDNLIATARSNKVATCLGIQDFSQLRKDYGREEAEVLINIIGNIISGQVTGETAKNLSDRFGKILQNRESLSINRSDTSLSKSKQLELAIPPSKISSLSSGEFVGMVADNPTHKIELKNSKSDSFASAANYLNKIGWKNNQPCFYKIDLKNNIPKKYLNTSAKKIKNKKKISYFKKYIIDFDKINVKKNIYAAIITPDKDIIPDSENLSPAYLIFTNYELILKWNRSLRFALAVCTLKNEFKNAL